MCLVGRKAPDFKAVAVMPDGNFKEVHLESDYRGQSVLLFFYPMDFTFVCPSEIVAFDKAIEEFTSRGVQVIGCSVDSASSHQTWREMPTNCAGIGKVRFPILADIDGQISEKYNVTSPTGITLRGLFIMDKDHNICHSLVNDLPIGRSVDEAIRIIDAMQFHQRFGDVCPANWKKGQKGMKPTRDGAAHYLCQNV